MIEEDTNSIQPEIGNNVTDVYQAIYKLGASIPTFAELDDLAKRIDTAVLDIDRFQQGTSSDVLADFHTVVSRWAIRANKQDILQSLKMQTPGEGMGSILLLDATYNYSMQMAQRSRDVDFLLDLMLVCKWESAAVAIKQLITQLSTNKD